MRYSTLDDERELLGTDGGATQVEAGWRYSEAFPCWQSHRNRGVHIELTGQVPRAKITVERRINEMV